MKFILSTLIIFLILVFGQKKSTAQNEYFQQKVNYTIEVRLDDRKHELNGHIVMDYKNNAPTALSELYFHLWPNAYKNNNTAFVKQKLNSGNTDFYFAPDEEKGGIDSLSFQIDGVAHDIQLDPKNPDIGLIKLATPVNSGQTVKIESPFRVKIPNSYSRLGHVETSYQMTQWYPKPAVFDKNGWHPMPYLDQGEFYSEFGSFDVKITLPDNYIVGATGTLLNEDEKEFLLKKADKDKRLNFNEVSKDEQLQDFPPSSETTKTLNYVAKDVHDFAWFADKRFYVLKGEVELSSGKKVDTWAYFTSQQANIWKRGTDYIGRSVKYYSDVVGEYPYPHATAVQSALSAGAGMEYPMITVIGLSRSARALDEVITHEVGHNWFYGILGSNEREHAWLDEGLNSYVESRYMKNFYDDEALNLVIAKVKDINYLAYLFQARRARDQAIETPSIENTSTNYFLSAYSKPTLAFTYLENYLGTETMDELLKAYFNKWKFKHPQPEDLKAVFEDKTEKNLDWFFDQVIGTTDHLDFALTGSSCCSKHSTQPFVKIKNTGEINAPFHVAAIKDDSVVAEKWIEGLAKGEETTVQFEVDGIDRFELDTDRKMPDFNRKNNEIKSKGAFKQLEKLQLKWLTGIEEQGKTSIFYTPMLAWNNYDKTMLGLVVHNLSIPAKQFEFLLAPFYATGSKDVSGLAKFGYSFYPKTNWLDELYIGTDIRKFNYFYNFQNDYHNQYIKAVPTVSFKLQPKKRNSTVRQEINFKTHLIWKENAVFASSGEPRYLGNAFSPLRSVFQLNYQYKDKNVLSPLLIKPQLEFYSDNTNGFRDNSYLKLEVSAEQKFAYNGKKQFFYARFFGSTFLLNNNREFNPYSVNLIHRGQNDFNFEHYHLGRSEQQGFFSQQIFLDQGGFKTPVLNSQADGRSNLFIAAINLKSDIPIKFPFKVGFKVRPYLDVGYYRNTAVTFDPANQFFLNGGIALEINDVLGVYFPIFSSRNLSMVQQSNYFQRIGFFLNLDQLDPASLIRNIDI